MLNKTLLRQSNQAFKTLLDALSNAPEGEFDSSSGSYEHSIGKVAMHIAGSIDSTFPPGTLFDKWNAPVSNKEECIAYIHDCKTIVLDPYIESTGLLVEDEAPQFFVSKLDRVMKIMRHIAQHTGEINSRLSTLGLKKGRFIF